MRESDRWCRLCGKALSAIVSLGLLLAGPGALAADEKPRLLAFGDSLVHGYGLGPGETFPEQLEAALEESGCKVRVVNAGQSGDTSATGLSRLDWALAGEPDAVLVVLGANDGLRGLDPKATNQNLDKILARLTERDLPVLFAGMLAPRNLGDAYVEEFDAIYPSLARKHDVLFFPFFLEGVALDPDLVQADGLHPNPEGVARIVEGILPKVRELMASQGCPGEDQQAEG